MSCPAVHDAYRMYLMKLQKRRVCYIGSTSSRNKRFRQDESHLSPLSHKIDASAIRTYSVTQQSSAPRSGEN